MLIGRMTRQWVKVMWQTSARTDTPLPAILWRARGLLWGNGENKTKKENGRKIVTYPDNIPLTL